MSHRRPGEWWAIEWHVRNRLEGDRRGLIWESVPRLYRTRAEARAFIEARYGYIRDREDLRAEPHGWLMPRAVRVKVEAVQ